jgi:hypothetical protein
MVMTDGDREICATCRKQLTPGLELVVPEQLHSLVRGLVHHAGLTPELRLAPPVWLLFAIPDPQRQFQANVNLKFSKPAPFDASKDSLRPSGTKVDLRKLSSMPPKEICRALRKFSDAGFLVTDDSPTDGNLQDRMSQRLVLRQYYMVAGGTERFCASAEVFWSADAKSELLQLYRHYISPQSLTWPSFTDWGKQFLRTLDLCAGAGTPSYRLCIDAVKNLERDARDPESGLRRRFGDRPSYDWTYFADYMQLHLRIFEHRVAQALGEFITSPDPEELEETFKREHGVQDIHDYYQGTACKKEWPGGATFTLLVQSLDVIVRRMSAGQVRWEHEMTARPSAS